MLTDANSLDFRWGPRHGLAHCLGTGRPYEESGLAGAENLGAAKNTSGSGFKPAHISVSLNLAPLPGWGTGGNSSRGLSSLVYATRVAAVQASGRELLSWDGSPIYLDERCWSL